jgi:hypothetical protein
LGGDSANGGRRRARQIVYLSIYFIDYC